jgi:hypothetical protein
MLNTTSVWYCPSLVQNFVADISVVSMWWSQNTKIERLFGIQPGYL